LQYLGKRLLRLLVFVGIWLNSRAGDRDADNRKTFANAVTPETANGAGFVAVISCPWFVIVGCLSRIAGSAEAGAHSAAGCLGQSPSRQWQ